MDDPDKDSGGKIEVSLNISLPNLHCDCEYIHKIYQYTHSFIYLFLFFVSLIIKKTLNAFDIVCSFHLNSVLVSVLRCGAGRNPSHLYANRTEISLTFMIILRRRGAFTDLRSFRKRKRVKFPFRKHVESILASTF